MLVVAVALSILVLATEAFVGPSSIKTFTVDRSQKTVKSFPQGGFFTQHSIPLVGPMRAEADGKVEKTKLPFWLDPGTKGGAVFLSLALFLFPILVYSIMTTFFGFDEIETGKWIGIGFTVLATLGWVSTYLFRVATKDMTYAKQLKDYENAVIAKRLEELDEDEIQALQEEVERDAF